MSAKHTPGPWLIRSDATGTHIEIRHPRPYGWAQLDLAKIAPAEECEANADLIAAAPDLLAACQAVLDEFPATDGRRIESVKAICSAALRKAGVA